MLLKKLFLSKEERAKTLIEHDEKIDQEGSEVLRGKEQENYRVSS